ncbi:MAG: DUF72 domain-containing protein [Planctomycetota bacterium]
MTRATTKVGCCGFPVARPKYFEKFSLVEIQQTFYQPPQPDTAKRWRDQAPADFEFTLKAWQLVTHEPSSPTYRRLKIPLSETQKKQLGAFRWTDAVRRAWQKTLEIAQPAILLQHRTHRPNLHLGASRPVAEQRGRRPV